MAAAAAGGQTGCSAVMWLDPNTHAMVLWTAFLTSVAFAIFAMNLIALVLQHLFY